MDAVALENKSFEWTQTDLNARVYVNCRQKDGRTEKRMPISHLAKAGATKMIKQ